MQRWLYSPRKDTKSCLQKTRTANFIGIGFASLGPLWGAGGYTPGVCPSIFTPQWVHRAVIEFMFCILAGS